MQLHLTTNPGLEDLVADELRARAAALGLPLGPIQLRPGHLAGVVEAALDAAPEALWRPLRSVHLVLEPLDRFTLDAARPLEHLAERAAQIPLSVFREADSFRVTGDRQGAHPFTSMDLARVVGGVVHDASGVAVKMKGYDLELRVSLSGWDCRLDVQRSHAPLSKRYPRKHNLRTALSANVAYALLRLTLDDRVPRTLLDPCCGTGTVLLEAASLYPEATLYGGELFERPARLAAENLEGVAEVRVADARELGAAWGDQKFDAVVSNPPFGANLGERTNFDAWYARFLEGFVQVTRPGARLGVLVLKRAAFKRALKARPELALVRARQVSLGVVEPGLYVVERVGGG
ncbi:MAG: methyltransferase [Alphaproteobacteria bacterium]|nr:methyltransferase [Alphaproteobacteria bacterium]